MYFLQAFHDHWLTEHVLLAPLNDHIVLSFIKSSLKKILHAEYQQIPKSEYH